MASAAGLALVGAAGCSALGGDKEDASSAPPPNALASLDPCQVLTQQDLSAYGIEGPGTPVKDVPWAPGCMYQSSDLGLSVYADTKDTVESTHSHSQWAKWDNVDIVGRPGAVAVNGGSKNAHICNAMFDSGRGRINVQAETNKDGDSSECQKAQDVAKQVAPRMPPKQ